MPDTFNVGDRVRILAHPAPFYRSYGQRVPHVAPDYTGHAATITDGPDADGDFALELADGTVPPMFAPECLVRRFASGGTLAVNPPLLPQEERAEALRRAVEALGEDTLTEDLLAAAAFIMTGEVPA